MCPLPAPPTRATSQIQGSLLPLASTVPTPSPLLTYLLPPQVQSLRAQLEAWRLQGEAPSSAPRPQEDGHAPPGYISQVRLKSCFLGEGGKFLVAMFSENS